MKKKDFIIVFLILIIIVLGVVLYTYIKNNNQVEENTENNSTKSSNIENNNNESNNIQNNNTNKNVATQLKNKEKIFFDNICLAIGYVPLINDEEFSAKYFESYEVYKSITTYDFENERSEFSDKFVIIPKDDDVKITIYDCYIDTNGELQTKNVLAEKISGTFILNYNNMESTTPQYCIKFEYNGFEETFPLVFSGMNGKLDLTGYEMEVLDISIYNEDNY